MGLHDEFFELCAVSTSGDLTEEEQKMLQAHLAECAECRNALREFEAAVDIGVPLLASNLSSVRSKESATRQMELAGSALLSGVASKRAQTDVANSTGGEERDFAFTQRRGYRRPHVNWNYVWMSFAACLLLMAALGIYAYRVGEGHKAEIAPMTSGSAGAQIETLEERISDVGHEREILRAQLVQRDKVIAELRHRTELESRALNEMKIAQANVEHTLQNHDLEKLPAVDERASLAQKFDLAQASLEKMQSELDSARRQRAQDEAQDASLQSQIKDLSDQLHEEQQTIDRQAELLSHDRDIRELMGARDLYVAEVYDVARDGTTQKSYGRLFYTKGKSLIFYAYDLEQEPGVRNASTFQAWGRRGPDRQQPLNLGILYEDNVAKKRWVLKFDNPKALDEIDAVFVTLEPKGGSQKPSGKPLLYAQLQMVPNHP